MTTTKDSASNEGKVAIVTGSSRGIGASIARRLASEGFTVIVNYAGRAADADAVVAAIRAGMDMIEICHSPELILRAYEALIAEAERSAAFRTLLLKRAQEAAKKRVRIVPSQIAKALTTKQYEALRAKVRAFHDKVRALAEESAPNSVGSALKPLVETA